MKIWVDDVRPEPEGYVRVTSVLEAKELIEFAERQLAKADYVFYDMSHNKIEVIDMDHDAGDYARFGGNYINLLCWLEEIGRSYPIRIHSANPVGVKNMRRIIRKNGWKEVR